MTMRQTITKWVDLVHLYLCSDPVKKKCCLNSMLLYTVNRFMKFFQTQLVFRRDATVRLVVRYLPLYPPQYDVDRIRLRRRPYSSPICGWKGVLYRSCESLNSFLLLCHLRNHREGEGGGGVRERVCLSVCR